MIKLFAVLAVFAIIPAANATPPASVTLQQGVVAGGLSFELGVAKGSVLEPTSVAPDLAVGITDRFTLGLVSSGSALTGFRGSAGSGFCMTTPEQKCPSPYTAGGVESLFALTRGSVALAANAGVIWSSFEPTVRTDLKLGFKLRLAKGKVFALLSPNVWLALDDRLDPARPHEHQLWVPISFWVKPAARLALGLGTGVKGPLDHFNDRMSIPGGGLVQLAVDPRVSIGGSFVFGKLLGGSAVMDAGIEARVVQVWINLTSG